MIIMTEQQYNELLKAYTKEALASMYCQQFDDFKNIADFFEFAAKLMRR